MFQIRVCEGCVTTTLFFNVILLISLFVVVVLFHKLPLLLSDHINGPRDMELLSWKSTDLPTLWWCSESQCYKTDEKTTHLCQFKLSSVMSAKGLRFC